MFWSSYLTYSALMEVWLVDPSNDSVRVSRVGVGSWSSADVPFVCLMLCPEKSFRLPFSISCGRVMESDPFLEVPPKIPTKPRSKSLIVASNESLSPGEFGGEVWAHHRHICVVGEGIKADLT